MSGPGSLLVERFDRVRRAHPHRPLVRVPSQRRTVSAADVWHGYETWRRLIAAAGLPRGSAVLSLIGNRAALFPFLLAVRDLGAVPVLADSAPTGYELERLIGALGPSAVVGPADLPLPVTASSLALPDGLSLYALAPGTGRAAVHDAHLVKLTSGSGGVPKAVACRESHLIADGTHIVEAMGIGPDDVNLGAIPLSHSYGLGNVVMPLLLQGTGVVLRETFTPHRFIDDVVDGGVSVLPGVPYMYDHLLQRLGGQALPPSLRLLVTAGARIRLETVLGFGRHFGRKIHGFYGTSETGGIAFDDAERIDEALPVGRPLPGTVVTLRGASGAGEGRVHVRGAAVADGYAVGGEEDGAGFVEGGFLTGDLARMREGVLVLTGRTSATLNVGGRKVHPVEIERVLLELPEVEAACVFGVGDEMRGDTVVACLVPAPGSSVHVSTVRGHCARRLSPYKVPRRFVLTDALPVDARGKVSRQALRALVAGREGAAEHR